MSAGAVPVTLARPCSPGPLSVGARVLCPSLAHSPLQLSHRPRGVGRTQRVRAALAQGHEGGVAAIPSVRRALPYPAATPTPGWGRTSAKSRAGSPALSKRSRSVACFFLLFPPFPSAKIFAEGGRKKWEGWHCKCLRCWCSSRRCRCWKREAGTAGVLMTYARARSSGSLRPPPAPCGAPD